MNFPELRQIVIIIISSSSSSSSSQETVYLCAVPKKRVFDVPCLRDRLLVCSA
jgi:hypothetical protein